jgi:hypothetical protein
MRKYYTSKVVKNQVRKQNKIKQKKDDSINESPLEIENIEIKEENSFSLLIANILTAFIVIS